MKTKGRDVTKNGAKTGFSPITQERHVKNNARLILYLDIITCILRYFSLYNKFCQAAIEEDFCSSLMPLKEGSELKLS